MTQEELLELVYYEDGVLYWRHTKKGRRSNIVGNFEGKYWRACINYKRYQLHHLIWLYHKGEFPEHKQLDHIDGNPNNNKIENLRDEPQSVNVKNAKRNKRNTSGFNGVGWRANRGVWFAIVIKEDGSRITRNFKDKDDARAWQKEESMKHGYHENHGEIR